MSSPLDFVAFKARAARAGPALIPLAVYPEQAEQKRESPLEAVAASLRLKEQVLDASRKILPALAHVHAGPASTKKDLNDAFLARFQELRSAHHHAVPDVLAERDRRWEYAAKLRWKALLELTELEERHPSMPWFRRVLSVADRAAPSGFLTLKTMDVCLGKVYGPDVARLWHEAVSIEPLCDPPLPDPRKHHGGGGGGEAAAAGGGKGGAAGGGKVGGKGHPPIDREKAAREAEAERDAILRQLIINSTAGGTGTTPPSNAAAPGPGAGPPTFSIYPGGGGGTAPGSPTGKGGQGKAAGSGSGNATTGSASSSPTKSPVKAGQGQGALASSSPTKGQAGYGTAPGAAAAGGGPSSSPDGKGKGKGGPTSPTSPTSPGGPGSPLSPNLSPAAATMGPDQQAKVARLWAQLWIGFSTPVTGASPLATLASGGQRLPGLHGYKGPAFDMRLFGAACAMLPGLRKNMDIRVMLVDGLKSIATFTPFPAGMMPPKETNPVDDGSLIMRQDIDCVLALPLYRRADVAALEAAVDQALMEGLVSHRGNYYPARPDSTVLVSGVRDFVLTAPALRPWTYAPALSGGLDALEAARQAAQLRKRRAAEKARGWAVDEDKEADGPQFVAGSPLSGLEQRSAPAFSSIVRGNKVANYQWNLAVAAHKKRLLVKHFLRLKEVTRRRKAAKTVLYAALDSYHFRAVNAVRTPFSHWRTWTVQQAAAVRLQSAWRMSLTRKNIKRYAAAVYIATQIGRLWRWKQANSIADDYKWRRIYAVITIQKYWRGFQARKRAAIKLILKSQEEFYAIKKLQAETGIKRREKAAFVVTRAVRRFVSTRNAKSAAQRLREAARAAKLVNWGREQITAWVERQRKARAELDRYFPVPGVWALSAVKQAEREAKRAQKEKALAQVASVRKAAKKTVRRLASFSTSTSSASGSTAAAGGAGGGAGAGQMSHGLRPGQQGQGQGQGDRAVSPGSPLSAAGSFVIRPSADGGGGLRRSEMAAGTGTEAAGGKQVMLGRLRDLGPASPGSPGSGSGSVSGGLVKAQSPTGRGQGDDGKEEGQDDAEPAPAPAPPKSYPVHAVHAVRALARFFKLVRARLSARRIALLRYERRYDVETNTYLYWDRGSMSQLAGRPAVLGNRTEVEVADLWVARWDPVVPDTLHYFHMRHHTLAWEQPAGTVLCPACERRFAELWCGGPADAWCRRALCRPCFDKQHKYISDMYRSAAEWTRHPHLPFNGGGANAVVALAILQQVAREDEARAAGRGGGSTSRSGATARQGQGRQGALVQPSTAMAAAPIDGAGGIGYELSRAVAKGV